MSAIVTTIGLAKLATAAGGGAAVVFAELAVGSGVLTPAVGTTALVDEEHRVDVARVTSPASGVVRIEAHIPASSGGYTIREWGVFDEAGDLLVCGTIGPIAKASSSSGEASTLVLRPEIGLSSTTGVTLTVDDTVVLASVDYVDTLWEERLGGAEAAYFQGRAADDAAALVDPEPYATYNGVGIMLARMGGRLRKRYVGEPLLRIVSGSLVASAAIVRVLPEEIDTVQIASFATSGSLEVDLDLVSGPGAYDVWLEYSEDRETFGLVARPYMYYDGTVAKVSPPPERGVLIGGFAADWSDAIYPRSVWDLQWRPSCPNPRGMVLIGGRRTIAPGIGTSVVGTVECEESLSVDTIQVSDALSAGLVWVDIWPVGVAGVVGLSTVPKTSAGAAQALSLPTWPEAIEALAQIGKRLPYRHEYVSIALGAVSANATLTTATHANSRSTWGVESSLHDSWHWLADCDPAGGALRAGEADVLDIEAVASSDFALARGVSPHICW